MKNLHRIFIAINLPLKLQNELSAYQDQWLELPARWTRPENLHITLNYLGNANDEEICDICSLAAQVVKRHEPIEITLNRICYGPLRKFPPRMIWAVGEKSGTLGRLQMDFENTLHEFAGADSDTATDCTFAPHVTLARVKQTELKMMEAEEIPVIDETIKRNFLVDSIEVMESEMKRGGPNYIILESIKLGE